MIAVRPFAAEDIAALAMQPGQAKDWADPVLRDARAELFAAQPLAATLWRELLPIACFGFVESHVQHLTAWAALAALTSGELLFATRWCRGWMARLRVRRIDMAVRADFAPAVRWAAMLGFAHEGTMRAFYPDGGDMQVWARVEGTGL